MIDAALLFPKLLERAGDNAELAEAAAKTAWKRIAGEGLANQATPLKLRDKTLTVIVTDDVWKKQLERMSKEFTSRINKLLRREIVSTIEFRVDPRATKSKSVARSTTTDKIVRPPANVVASAAEIEDAGLRERFIRAATNCIDRREAARQPAIQNPPSEI